MLPGWRFVEYLWEFVQDLICKNVRNLDSVPRTSLDLVTSYSSHLLGLWATSYNLLFCIHFLSNLTLGSISNSDSSSAQSFIFACKPALWLMFLAALRPRIFNWVHRKFRQNHDYGAKDSSDGHWSGILQCDPACTKTFLDDKDRAIRMPYEDEVVKGIQGDMNYTVNIDAGKNEDTEALLGHRETVTVLFSNWQHGLLAIGTFGIDQIEGELADHDYLKDVESFEVKSLGFKEPEVEVFDPSEVDDLEEELEKVFGVNKIDQDVKLKCQAENKGLTDCKGTKVNQSTDHDNVVQSKDQNPGKCKNSNRGNKPIYPLQDFFEAPLLAEAVKKKEHRTTLADLFSRSTNHTSNIFDDAKIDDEPEKIEMQQKSTEALAKSGRSFMKKILKWKKGVFCGDYGAKTKLEKQMMRMFHRKIYPDNATGLHGSGLLGRLDVAKTFKTTSKVRELEDDNSVTKPMFHNEHSDSNQYNLNQDVMGSPNRDCELVSLLRDISRGSQECWIKTDSEYVVLEL
eukprot:Gb_30065 [translate_table: standard]